VFGPGVNGERPQPRRVFCGLSSSHYLWRCGGEELTGWVRGACGFLLEVQRTKELGVGRSGSLYPARLCCDRTSPRGGAKVRGHSAVVDNF
jgi:hypothetical protein